MYLENGRAVMQGAMLLILAAIAYMVDVTIGIALVTLMGLMILQSAFTDWCPSDLFLRKMGLKKKLNAQ